MAKLTVLSYGAGQDSTAILLKMIHDPDFRASFAPEDFVVIMSDTGDEHAETYEHVKHTRELCRNNGIEFVLIIPEMGYHLDSWQTLRGFYRAKGTVGSKAFPKTCTDNLKIAPIYKFLDDYVGRRYGITPGRKRALREFSRRFGKIDVLIGIAKGEEKRVAGEARDAWKREAINMVYPLIEIGFGRSECQGFMREIGETIPLPSNCLLCPFMSEIELVWLFRFRRKDYEDWVVIEATKLEKNTHMGKSNLGVWGKRTLPEVLDGALVKFGKMSDADLWEYKMSHGHCVASRY